MYLEWISRNVATRLLVVFLHSEENANVYLYVYDCSTYLRYILLRTNFNAHKEMNDINN